VTRVRAGGSAGLAPAFAITAALGLFVVALADNTARTGGSLGSTLFWFGLCMIFAPIAFRLLGSGADRGERLALVVILGLCLFLVKVLGSPSEFVRFDEFGWWRATQEVLITGHTFTGTQLNTATAGYPALPVLTAAIADLSGLSIFHAALVLIAVLRVVFVIALFIFLERTLGSDRAAGIGVVVYACNSSFVYFDVQFGYESLALVLAVVLMVVVRRWAFSHDFPPEPVSAAVAVVGVIVACGLTISHHLTSLFVVAFLAIWTILWLLVGRRSDRSRPDQNGPGVPLLVLALLVASWLLLVAGTSTLHELGGLFVGAYNSISDLILGTNDSKQLFSGAGEGVTLLERGMIGFSTLAALAVIGIGILRLRKKRPAGPLPIALGIVALLDLVSLGLRLTQASSEIAGRAPAFTFIGIAFLAGLISLGKRGDGWTARTHLLLRLALTASALVAFLGAFMLGELKVTRQPGSYLVGAESRSITPQGVAAANFAGSHLPANDRVLADRTNASLMGSYGRLEPLFGAYKHRSVARVLVDRDLERRDLKVLRVLSANYVVVDRRLSREAPYVGIYVDSAEPEAGRRTEPVSRAALEKFESARGFSKIYSNGPISIYKVEVETP
jgi:hypothetical protein